MRDRGSLMLILGLLCPAVLCADLRAVMAEPKLEKRSEKALKNAHGMLDVAREAYLKGDAQLLESALREVQESVELAYKSLKETGKNPRKNFKHFKRAEISSRQLLRRLETFRGEMSVFDREVVEAVIQGVQKVHEQLLHDIMGGGK